MKTMTRAAMRAVVAGLAKLPAKAWLSVRTWEALTRGAAKPGARLSVKGPGGQVLPGVQVLDPSVDDFLDVAASGVVTVGAVRYWVLPVRVLYDGALEPRLVRLDGAVNWREARLVTTDEQVPGIIAFFTPAGLWADGTQPLWRAVDEVDPGGAYPAAVVNAEVMVEALPVAAVARVAPSFFARL